MTVWTQGLINGLALGGLYALFALGVVVLYRTTTVVNFAQANTGMVSAFLSYEVLIHTRLPLWIVFAAGVVAGALVGAGTYVFVIAPNRSRDHLNDVFRTLALMLLLLALAKREWGAHEPYTFPSLFTYGGFRVAGYTVLWLQVGIAATAVVCGILFALVLRTPRLGLKIRAVASDRSIARMIGLRVGQVEVIAWAIAGMLAAATAMLLAPLLSLATDAMAPLLLKGFAAALLGGLTSFGGAIFAGFAVGVLDSEVAVHAQPEWRDIANLLLMLGILLVRPAGLFGRKQAVRV